MNRIASVMKAENKSDAILISSHPERLDKQAIDPKLSFRRLKRFPDATVGDETYTIFRVTMKHGGRAARAAFLRPRKDISCDSPVTVISLDTSF